MESMLVNQNLQ